ncbi:calcineurin-like phosphoesterase C-terminal domain-containing protein [Zhouia spongiae]|uniref:Calcineurin-like phosphoesterase C-terminal domain-containing protein n=1 Tax=Zhouia spongiae TaxID=2202721 RepID=A0ABY3YJC4_9FLAO|nr:calcineurin-like phosphoesterase family protein [Zhouia spongiae]UNY97917.1 calcineurin-like phosphoesterase C-terminal domain-containing protein [Zhouia spongiae]
MNRSGYLFGLFVIVAHMVVGQSYKISGRVYHDENRNGSFEEGEKLLGGVFISNGRDIVSTDTDGVYKIKPLKNNPIFIIKPKGYISPRTPQNNLKFYHLYQELNKNRQFDFPLYENKEKDTVHVALLGDPQADVIDDIHHVNKLVTEELAKSRPDIIVPLGDLSFDNLRIFKPLSETLGLVDVPVYYVIGNHDLNFGEKEFSDRDKTFEASFGPSYYAFEFGNNLFLVLNNNFPVNDREYIGKFDTDQLTFVAGVADKLGPRYKGVKVFSHIPLEYTQNKEALIELITPFEKVLVVTGHTHTQYHHYFERKDQAAIHQLVGGAVCGAWWQGAHDIDGVPFAMMHDGTPKGYWRLKTNDDTYKLRYKVSGAPKEKQMNIWVPEHKEWDKEMNVLNEPYIYANVFAADSKTDVQLSFDGKTWHRMEHYPGVSPELKRFYLLQELGRYNGQKLSKAPKPVTKSKHLWRFKISDRLKAGTYLIKVRADNTFLDLHEEEVRVFRKEK